MNAMGLIRAIGAQHEALTATLTEPLVRCPEHRQVVGVLRGKLLGRCSGCAEAAAVGIQRIQEAA